MRTSWTARIGLGRGGPAAADPDGALADVVGRRGEAELRAGDRQPERRALVEVGQQLARTYLRRAGVARLRRELLSGSQRPGRDPSCPRERGRNLLRRPARRLAVPGRRRRVRPSRRRSFRPRAGSRKTQVGVRRRARQAARPPAGRASSAAVRRRRAGSRRGSRCAGPDPGGRTRSGADPATSPDRCRRRRS